MAVLLGTAAIITSSHIQIAALNARRHTLIPVSLSLDARWGYEATSYQDLAPGVKTGYSAFVADNQDKYDGRLVRGGASKTYLIAPTGGVRPSSTRGSRRSYSSSRISATGCHLSSGKNKGALDAGIEACTSNAGESSCVCEGSAASAPCAFAHKKCSTAATISTSFGS